MKWNDAVIRGLRRFARRHKTRKINRRGLLQEELQQIVNETQSKGITPEQTLSRVLQELRDQGLLYFLDQGTYLLLDTPLDVETEDLPDDALDFALSHEKLRLGSVSTSSEKALARRRRGQDRLRVLTLHNYGSRCALCDVTDERLLVVSHISRWADDPEASGDFSNVICLCRFHDALFEHGYLSLSDDLTVLRKNDGGSRTVALNLEIAEKFQPPPSYPPSPVYLRKHRQRTGYGG